LEKRVFLQKIIFMPIDKQIIEKQKVKKEGEFTLTQVVVDALQEIKGRDIVEIGFGHCPEQPLFDTFILCSATSTTQAEALCENVLRRVYERLRLEPSHYEGKDQAQWILIDYFNLLVHIFLEDKRRYYDIEGLWNDADILSYAEPESSPLHLNNN
jgi:ribosome-associated protein